MACDRHETFIIILSAILKTQLSQKNPEWSLFSEQVTYRICSNISANGTGLYSGPVFINY